MYVWILFAAVLHGKGRHVPQGGGERSTQGRCHQGRGGNLTYLRVVIQRVNWASCVLDFTPFQHWLAYQSAISPDWLNINSPCYQTHSWPGMYSLHSWVASSCNWRVLLSFLNGRQTQLRSRTETFYRWIPQPYPSHFLTLSSPADFPPARQYRPLSSAPGRHGWSCDRTWSLHGRIWWSQVGWTLHCSYGLKSFVLGFSLFLRLI